MNARTMLLAAGAMALLGACSRTESGDIEVKKPVDVDVKTQTETLHTPTIGTRIDTINTPVVGTKTETLIVKKPVVGTQKSVVKVPVIKKP